MATKFQMLDRLTLVAPLGLRFHDVASGVFVGDGLSVAAYPVSNSRQRVSALANRSGVYVLHHAPGLGDFERGAGDEEFWNNLPPGKSFVIEVVDDERRFQPFRFTAELPVRGIFNWVSPLDVSPATTTSSIPLYSAPARHVPAGMVAIRADFWDTSLDAPAPWVVLEAYTNNQLLARGIADDQGRIALIFPYPAPRPFSSSSPVNAALSSPPTATGPPLVEQSWPITLQAMYAPLSFTSSPLESEQQSEPSLPDLRETLMQPQAVMWADQAQTEPLTETLLNYGRETILKSLDQNNASQQSPPSSSMRGSVLFITPAGSPP